jgi:type IV secretory pathway TraG/TraD family ATPase VirD4
MEENVNEIARTLFYEKTHASNQPFFPSAAKDIFAAVLTHFCCTPELDNDNAALRRFLDGATTDKLLEMLREYADLAAMTSYISGDGAQAGGILSELQQMSREIFVGDFKKSGNIAMRKLVRGKGARTIFIEYDLGLGNMLTPIYRLMFDMAIKEALSRDKSAGNVWLVADEFRLIPHLQHAENAVNFGRGLGVKFLIGIQNIDQMIEAYGQNMAHSILSGFSTQLIFRLNDHSSREYVKKLHGENRKAEVYQSPVKNVVENIRVGNVVEDWDISTLEVGEAIVGLPGREPFMVRFDEYNA